MGSEDYSIGLASGNVGNGRYAGVSETDRALLDRMHVVMDLDNFDTQPEDDLAIIASKHDPRVSEAKADDKTETILQLRRELAERAMPQINYIVALYLRKGLDYLENVPGNSKRKVKNAWPQVVQGRGRGSDEVLIFPVSPRAAITYLTLANALEAIVESKGGKVEDHAKAFLDTFALAGAYSGILNPREVDQHYRGNAHDAMLAIVEGIKKEFKDRERLIAAGIGMAKQGKLEAKILDEFSGRWGFMKSVLEKTAQEAKDRKGKETS